MCSWDVIWRNLYKCGRKRSKVHLSRLSPFHFRSPAFWFFFWISDCPKPARLSDNSACFNVRNHRIPPDSQLRCHFLHFLPSLGRLRSFGNFGCQHFLKSKHSKTEIPSVRFHLVLPQKENESPKTKMWGLCRRTIYLYKYIIIDVSLSSKSSVISTSSRNVLDWGPSTAAPLVLPSSSHLRFGFHAYPNLGTVGRVRWLPEKNMQRPAVCNGSMTCKII